MAFVLAMAIYSGRRITATGTYRRFPIAGTALTRSRSCCSPPSACDTPFWQTAIYMAVLGTGLGLTMQILMLAAQNSVPYSELGVATSIATFSRSIGGVARCRGVRHDLQQPARGEPARKHVPAAALRASCTARPSPRTRPRSSACPRRPRRAAGRRSATRCTSCSWSACRSRSSRSARAAAQEVPLRGARVRRQAPGPRAAVSCGEALGDGRTGRGRTSGVTRELCRTPQLRSLARKSSSRRLTSSGASSCIQCAGALEPLVAPRARRRTSPIRSSGPR